MRGDSVGADTIMYNRLFYDAVSSDFHLTLYDQDMMVEIGFVILSKIAAIFSNEAQLLIGLYAVLTMGLFYFIFKKHSCNLYLTTVLFCGLGMYPAAFNGMRQYLAIPFMYLVVYAIIERKLKKAIAFELIAICFHASSVIMILLFFLSPVTKKKIIISTLVASIIIILLSTIDLSILNIILSTKYQAYLDNPAEKSLGAGVLKGVLYLIIAIYGISSVKNRGYNKIDSEVLMLSFLLFLGALVTFFQFKFEMVWRYIIPFSLSICLLLPILLKEKVHNIVLRLCIYFFIIVGAYAYLTNYLNGAPDMIYVMYH